MTAPVSGPDSVRGAAAGVPAEPRVQALADFAFKSLTRAGGSLEGASCSQPRMASQRLDLTDPRQRSFGDYELLEWLGEGGTGPVYRARHLPLEREVAIKLLSEGPWASPEFVARFEREAQNAARMQHPNIVTVFEAGTHEDMHFFSMRLVEGSSLSTLLKCGARFAPKSAAALLRTTAEAVAYAHSLGVLHLDLKPGNVLIDAAGEPHVADFGLARRPGPVLALDNDEVSGTPAYMAPEQTVLHEQRLTAATDVWGLGAILYEIVTGHAPFQAESAQATLALVVRGQVRAPRRWNPALPLDLQAIMLKCLRKDPAQRYSTARALADDLARFVEGRPVHARPLNAMQRVARWARREPKLAVSIACAMLALLAGLVATIQQWQRAQANAWLAQANAATANARLWDSRDVSARTAMDAGADWKAAPLLLANLAEAEAEGNLLRAQPARKMLGIIEHRNPVLIDVLPVPGTNNVLAFSPDGSSLAATGGDSAAVRKFDLASGKLAWQRDVAGNPDGASWLAPEHMEFDAHGRSILLSSQRPMQVAPFPFGLFMYRVDARTGQWLAHPPVADPQHVEFGYSADGEHAITFNPESGVEYWQANPWRVQSSAPRFPGIAYAGPLLFAPDLRSFAFRGPDSSAVWVVATGSLRRSWKIDPVEFGHQVAWAFSPDSRWLALGDTDGSVIVADTVTRELRRLSPRPLTGIHELAFSEDGAWLAAAAGKSGVYLWRWPSGNLLVWPFGIEVQPERVRLDRAGLRVLASGTTGVAGLWEIPETQFELDRGDAVPLGGRIATLMTGRSGGGDATAWQPAKRLLASATGQGIQVQRIPPAVLKRVHAAPIKPATLRFDGRRLVVVEGRQVRLVGAFDERPLGAPFQFPQPPGFAELSADGRTLVVTAGRRLYAFDTASAKPRFTPVTLTNSPQHVDLNPDGTSVLTTWFAHDAKGVAEVAEVWDLHRGQRIGGPIRLSGVQAWIGYNREGTRLLAWNFAGVSMRDGHTLAAVAGPLADLRLAPHDILEEGYVRAVAFGSGGAIWLAMTRGDDPVISELRNYAADGTARSVRTQRPLTALVPLASGALLTVPEDAGMVVRRTDGSLHGLPDPTTGMPRAEVVVSQDGRWIARAQRDGVVLVDAATKARVALLRAPLPAPDLIWQLAFAADGNSLLARSMRNRLIVWNLQPDTRPVLEIARALALRDLAPGIGGSQLRSPPSAAERISLRAGDPGAPSAAASKPQPAARGLPGGEIPPRDPRAAPELIDLTNYYNFGFANISSASLIAAGDYQWLPTGIQRFLGIDYDLRGGIQMQAATGVADSPRGERPLAFDIASPRPDVAAVDVLVLLNPAATSIAHDMLRVTLQYADGGRASMGTLQFSAPWNSLRMSQLPKGLQVAAAGYDTRAFPIMDRPVHVYALRFPNPQPHRSLRSITFTAGDGSGISTVILAVSVEPSRTERSSGR